MAAEAQHSSSPIFPAVLRSNLNLPKSLLSLPDSCGRKKVICLACASSGWSASSWRSATNYALVRDWSAEGKDFLGCGRSVSRRRFQRRAGFVSCETIEEIEPEKSLIEKDTVNKGWKRPSRMFGRISIQSERTDQIRPCFDKVEVEYYGSPVSLKSIAQISTPDSSSLLVQPYDKSSLKAIEKAIVSSDLGLSPNNDGEVVRLSLPQLTNERRKELSKVVAKQTEEGKVEADICRVFPSCVFYLAMFLESCMSLTSGVLVSYPSNLFSLMDYSIRKFCVYERCTDRPFEI